MRTTARGEYYTEGVSSDGIKLKCKWLEGGDLEIITEPKAEAWLGVDDNNINQEKNAEKMVEIKGSNHNYQADKFSIFTKIEIRKILQ